MSPELLDAYRKHRAAGYSPLHFHSMRREAARIAAAPFTLAQLKARDATWSIGQVRFTAAILEDETGHCPEHLGRLYERRPDDCWSMRVLRVGSPARTRPAALAKALAKGEQLRDVLWYAPPTAPAEIAAGLRDCRIGRERAYEMAMQQIRQDCAAALRLWEGLWTYCGVRVTASVNIAATPGRVFWVDVHRASLWGIEDSAGDYFVTVALDLAAELVSELHSVRAALESLPGGAHARS